MYTDDKFPTIVIKKVSGVGFILTIDNHPIGYETMDQRELEIISTWLSECGGELYEYLKANDPMVNRRQIEEQL